MIKTCHASGHLQPNCQISSSTVVLNRSDWNRLKGDTLSEEGALKIATENESRYQEYVKQESKALNTELRAAAQNKEDALQQEARNRFAEANPRLERLKAADDEERKALIKKAEQMIQYRPQDPVNLQSSALLSDVLKERENQVAFQADQSNRQKAHKKLDTYQTLSQAEAWLAELNAKQETERRIREANKRDVFKMVQERRQVHKDNQKREVTLDRANKQERDREIEREMTRDNELMARKREDMRRNALEAMKIAEQRRIRQNLEEDVEGRIQKTYNEGSKQFSDEQRKAQQVADQAREAVKVQAADVLRRQTRPPRVDNTFATYGEIERDAREQERLERNKRIKAARIQQHLDEVAQREQREQLNLERRRQSAINRQRNLEVTHEFEKQKQVRQQRQMRDTHAKLHAQVVEKKAAKLQERENEKQYNRTDRAVAEDRQFYERASHLMRDAVNKGRPALPFQRTMVDYKKHAAIRTLEDQQAPPPHLVSRVEVAPGFSQAPPRCTKMTKKACKYELEELKMMNPYRRQKSSD